MIEFELLGTPIQGIAFYMKIINNYAESEVININPGQYVTVNRPTIGLDAGNEANIIVTVDTDEAYIDMDWSGGSARIDIFTILEENFEYGRTSPYTIIQMPPLPIPVFIDTTMRVGKVFTSPGIRIIYRRDLP